MGLYFYLHLTGYSVVRSLSEAPKYASVIANILKQARSKDTLTRIKFNENISMQGMYMEIYFFGFFFSSILICIRYSIISTQHILYLIVKIISQQSKHWHICI